jgi:hypothetical protein
LPVSSRLGAATPVPEICLGGKGLTKLTKGVFVGTFVSFVSAFEDSEVQSGRLLPTLPTLPQSWIHLDHFGGAATCSVDPLEQVRLVPENSLVSRSPAPVGIVSKDPPFCQPNQMMLGQDSEASVYL